MKLVFILFVVSFAVLTHCRNVIRDASNISTIAPTKLLTTEIPKWRMVANEKVGRDLDADYISIGEPKEAEDHPIVPDPENLSTNFPIRRKRTNAVCYGRVSTKFHCTDTYGCIQYCTQAERCVSGYCYKRRNAHMGECYCSMSPHT